MKESPACSKQAREEAFWTTGAGSQKQPPSAPHWSHEVSCPWGCRGHPRASGQAPILEATTPWEPQEIPKGHPETSRTRPPPQDLQMNPGCTQAPKQSQICAPPPPSLGAPPSLGPGTNFLPPGFAGSILEQVILYYYYLISTYFRVCQLSLCLGFLISFHCCRRTYLVLSQAASIC